MRYLLLISRIVFGLVFIFSGFVKAIDPLGFAYKLDDYFIAFGWDGLTTLSLPLSILVNTAEMLVGIAILLGIKMKVSAWGGLLFMALFTPLTLYIAIFEPVSDCGCFGDAVIISNWDTFFKNIVFLALAVFIFVNREKVKALWSEKKDWYLLGIGAIAGIILAIYCLRNLPLIDFRPWKVGNNVAQLMEGQDDVAEYYLVFENTETGQLSEYLANDYPWDDEEWNKLWKFKEQRIEVLKPGAAAAIEGFIISDRNDNHLTEELIINPDYYFMLVAYDLQKSNTKSMVKRVLPLASAAKERGLYFFILTSSPWDVVDQFSEEHDENISFYQSDDVNLRTIIRSNPGLLLMKEGVVIAKWAHRNIPGFDAIKRKFLE